MRLTARPFAALLLLPLVLTPRLALASQAARSAAAPAVAPLPKVRLVATGGTISNRTGGRLTAAELIGSPPRPPARVRRGHHERHRHARGDGVLPRSDRSERQARRRRRLDAQPEHARVRGRGEPA